MSKLNRRWKSAAWPFILALAASLAACGGQGDPRKTPPQELKPTTLEAVKPWDPTWLPASADDGFRLAFHLEDGETSKDSHVLNWSCRVEGFSAVYSGPHEPCERGQCAHKETRFALTAAQREVVITQLETGRLLRDHTSVNPVRGVGNWVKTALEVTRSGKTTRLRVEGMTNEWGRAGGKDPMDPDTRAVLSSLDALRRRLAAIAVGHFSEYLAY